VLIFFLYQHKKPNTMFMKLIFVGYFILIIAIIANMLAAYFDVCTWYEFIQNINEKGLKKTFYSQNIVDLIWLYCIYPILLSFGYIIGDKIYNLLT